MAIEMVDLPIKNGDLLYSYVSYLQLIYPLKMDKHGDFPSFFGMIFYVYQGEIPFLCSAAKPGHPWASLGIPSRCGSRP